MEMSDQQVIEATQEAVTRSEAETEDIVEEVVAVSETETQDAETETVIANEAVVEAEVPVEQEPVAEVVAESSEVVDSEIEGATAEHADGVDEASGGSSNGTANDQDPTDDDDGPVVRLLSVGQELQGRIKRVTDFGAFVDIGVGRDGLVHISELSVSRVRKVTDVVQEGQEVTLWIKKLDRDRNRISLTMIEPGQLTIRDLQKGEVVEGSVTRIMPYGAFVDVGVGRDALLHVREMAEGFVAKPEDVVQVGETIEVRIIDIARRRNRIDLSLKGLRPEPEAAIEEVQEAAESASEPEVQDTFADMEVLTPMQYAFLRAQEESGVEFPIKSRKAEKRARATRKRSSQDEIIKRTLNMSDK